MTLVGPVAVARRFRGPTIVRVGTIGLLAALAITVLAWLLTNDLFLRLRGSLEVTGEALLSVGVTLDVADEALGTLGASLETASTAADHASRSSETISEAVSETVVIVGEDLPASIEAIRRAMPGLIEAANVIDTTLSGLAVFGVPYNPELPLDEAFVALDEQLAPLPDSLRNNAAIIGDLIPEAAGFNQQAQILSGQVEAMKTSVEQAQAVIDDYRSQASRLDAVVADTSAGLGRTLLVARLLVVLAGALSTFVLYGLIMVGRAITELEDLPR